MTGAGDKPAMLGPDDLVGTLLVAFQPDRAQWLSDLLRRHGHDVLIAESVQQARTRRRRMDLVMVEVDDSPGTLEVCREIRDGWNGALIAVSGHDTYTERLRVLGAGCDDHLYWLCGPDETVARIDAVLGWVSRWDFEKRLVEFGSLAVDARYREVRLGEELVPLTRKEFDLLWLIASHRGEVVSREEICATVWGEDSAAVGATLDTHVSNLRKKIAPWVCVTVKGYGLRIGSPDETDGLS